ncbi:hypothetical protein Bhyg_00740 [Pseudolycoriella hygida]|uniref:YCII-related domain-containing protein n=1 Tax=Pseudolycoriella hygida TaxID=35572 RepID=A0A9Q0S585_9DIPT|nr:hypothetical protein Bhyg_00740 [Pseudolycoriella hygida]
MENLLVSATQSNMSRFFVLTYKYLPNVVTNEAPLRAAHLQLAQQYLVEGKLLLGGAFGDPIHSASAIFKTDTKEDIEKFVQADPYVQQGLVTEWKIREWTGVIGALVNSSL